MAERVAVIGIRGYGANHVKAVTQLAQDGEVTFVAGCDLDHSVREDLPEGVAVYTDAHAMLAEQQPDITTIATPPHTHFPLAQAALAAGSDVLLEKPPVVSLAQHRDLIAACRKYERVCQVGFQTLTSPVLARLLTMVSEFEFGGITGITGTAGWIRTDSYYQRSRWAGHRELDGTVVADGAATNPFAHTVMNALAVAEAASPGVGPVRLEVETYRCRDITTDDTVSARIHLDNGCPILLALTLCAEQPIMAPRIAIEGKRGSAIFEYGTRDRLTVTRDGKTETIESDAARKDQPRSGALLANLIAHRHTREGAAGQGAGVSGPGPTPLLAPLERTAPFTAFLQAMQATGVPPQIPEPFLRVEHADGGRRVVLRDINDLIGKAAGHRALFSELGVPWATTPVTVPIEAP